MRRKKLPSLGKKIAIVCTMLAIEASTPAFAQTQTREATANVTEFPKQILKTGVVLKSPSMSTNTMQLSDSIGLTPVLERIRNLRANLDSNHALTLETGSLRQELSEQVQAAVLIIQRTDLEIDFTLAEIGAELQVYNEILNTLINDRDKAVAYTNAASFISNGALWAVTEALAIPSYRNANFAIPSGIIGIPAGVVPSVASMLTLKLVNGKKKTSEANPNMLAKLFGYPTNSEIEYPDSVWHYLHQVPANDPTAKTRLDQIVDRWISDANMPAFTDRHSKGQLDVITASVARRKGLSIGTLTSRQVMLEQLSAEILKMKRLLLEITMAVQGDKEMTAAKDVSRLQ